MTDPKVYIRASKGRRAHSQGKLLLEELRKAGLPVHNVVKSRNSNLYTIDFKSPDVDDWSQSTRPAKEWAVEIVKADPCLVVKDTHDAIADWRPGKPVLTATIFVTRKPVEGDND